MYVCVHICIYTRMSDTHTFTYTHKKTTRLTPRTQSQRNLSGHASIYTRHPVRYDTTAICLNKIHAKNCILAQTR